MKKQIIFLLLAIFAISGCKSNADKNTIQDPANPETDWISLFDGESLEGWRSFQMDTIVGWTIENGYLTAMGEGSDLSGDIITLNKYKNFELYFEWKISPGGNSGVMFHVLEDSFKTTYATGPEFQLLDDAGYPSDLREDQKAGANYAMHVPQTKTLKPAGEFNTSRIIVNGPHVEHWMNGEKILEYELWSDDWKQRVEAGKWNNFPGYGKAREGHIALQDHGDKIWFRDIRIRIINAE